MPDDPIGDCPEKRFVLNQIIQVIHDAAAFGRVPDETKIKESYIQGMDALAQYVTGERFFWICNVVGFDPLNLSNMIVDLMRGRWKVDTNRIRKGLKNVEYAENGSVCGGWGAMAISDPSRHKELSVLGMKVRRSKRYEQEKKLTNTPA